MHCTNGSRMYNQATLEPFYQALHHYDELKVLLVTAHGSLKIHLQLTMSTHGKKFHISTPKNFVANTNTHFHKYSAQRGKDSKIRVLCVKKVFPRPKAVSADFSLEILYIEEINIQKNIDQGSNIQEV